MTSATEGKRINLPERAAWFAETGWIAAPRHDVSESLHACCLLGALGRRHLGVVQSDHGSDDEAQRLGFLDGQDAHREVIANPD